MKKVIVLIFSITLFWSCKNGEKSTISSEDQEKVIGADDKEKTAKQSDGLTLLRGDFLYLADAAVLQTHREVYAVVIDEKMHELDAKVKAFKKEDTDMIPVEVRAKITPKPKDEEGWDYRVEIKEILKVSKPDTTNTDTIKLGN